MRRLTVALLFAALFLAVSIPAVQAQQQEQPKEKKKPRKVWTNEDLSGLSGNINTVGQKAPPPAEAKPEQLSAADGDAVWLELDALRDQRADVEKTLANNRRWLENLTEEYRNTTDSGRMDTVLQARAEQEQRIVELEERLQLVNAEIAALEKHTKGKKRPAKAKPLAPKPAAPPPAGEAGQPPEEKPPAEPPPPPPPPPPSL